MWGGAADAAVGRRVGEGVRGVLAAVCAPDVLSVACVLLCWSAGGSLGCAKRGKNATLGGEVPGARLSV